MIANARIQPRASRSRTKPAEQAVMQQNSVNTGSEIWNILFQGSLLSQLARLSFHETEYCEVMTIAALDLRPDGWVVIGVKFGSSEPIERPVNHIRGVQILEAPSVDCEIQITLPPMA
jgi:hypothetical protein